MSRTVPLRAPARTVPGRGPGRGGQLALALSGAALLSACTVGPDYTPPELDLPDRWTGPADSAPLDSAPPDSSTPAPANWWTRLDDPVLDRIVTLAVAGNTDVASAAARIRQARASLRAAGGILDPQLSASGSAARQDATGGATGSSFQAGFDASWEADIFGGNARSVEAAAYGLGSAEAALQATLVTLIGDVATTYVEARGYQARIALAERTARSQRATAALTRTRYDAGAGTRADVANATGQAASTEADIPALELSYAEAVNRLSVLTGAAPGALAAEMRAPRPVPVPPLPVPVGLPAGLLSARPDIRVAERDLAQATAEIGVAEAARYPSVSLTGVLSTGAATLGSLADGSAINWSVGPGVSIPLFTGGTLAAQADIARAQRDESFIALRATVLTALEEVENAVYGIDRTRQQDAALRRAATAYREALDVARALYREGSADFLDVLDAERSTYSSEASVIQAGVSITTYYIALQKALGGGWDGEIDTASPAVTDAETGPRLR